MKLFFVTALMLLTSIANAADISGLWIGYYGYGPEDAQETPFAMIIKQQGATIQATIIEPVTFGDPNATHRQAQVLGNINDKQIQFIKQYSDGQRNAPVSYGLTVIQNQLMTGKWSIAEESGPVRMARVNAAEIKSVFTNIGL